MKQVKWISAKFYSEQEGISIQATYKRAKDGKVLSKKIGGRLHILNPNFKLENDGLKDEGEDGNEPNEHKDFKPIEPILETKVEKSVVAQGMMLRDAYQGNIEDIKASGRHKIVMFSILFTILLLSVVYFHQDKISFIKNHHSTLVENIKKEVESIKLSHKERVSSLKNLIEVEKEEKEKDKDFFRGKIEKIEKEKEDISKRSNDYKIELLQIKNQLEQIKKERDHQLEEINDLKMKIDEVSRSGNLNDHGII